MKLATNDTQLGQLLNYCLKQGITVLCAELQVHDYSDKESGHILNLRVNYTKEEYEQWIDSIKTYFSYQGESGIVWFTNNTWLEHCDVKGWQHMERPDVPQYLQL